MHTLGICPRTVGRSRTLGRTRGLTLIEVMMASSLLAVIIGSILMVSGSTNQAFERGLSVSEIDAAANRGLDAICERIMASSPANVSPIPGAPLNISAVDFQRNVGFDAGAALWGPPERLELLYSLADPNDGLDNDGNGLIDECRVVWTENPGLPDERTLTLCSGVAEYLEGEAFNFDDDNGNGLRDERGLSFDQSGDRVTVRLTVERLDGSGMLISRTVTRTVSFRGKDEP